MNLRRLWWWCLLVIIAFSMPVFAAEPNQIDSLDDINDVVGAGADPNWVERYGLYGGLKYGSYINQQVSGGPNEPNEGTGSMKFEFSGYIWPYKEAEALMAFDPEIDFSNYRDLAITFWEWVNEPNDTRPATTLIHSRLKQVILYDASDPNRIGRFALQPLKNAGWNKVIAPLRNFEWEIGGTAKDPDVVDWSNIARIGVWGRTEDTPPNSDIYIDDLQLEWAPDPCSKPYQVVSFDNIWDELWWDGHSTVFMVQSPPGDANVYEGSSSMKIDWVANTDGVGTDPNSGDKWDITPTMTLIPAEDFNDGNDWAVTLWVWTDLPGSYGDNLNDSFLWEIILHDVAGNRGFYRVPRADWDAGTGWTKVTARIDEFLWSDGGNFPNKMASDICLDAIVRIELWVMDYPMHGNNNHLDNLRIESAVEALSEAVVYNAEYTPDPLIIDGDASDWADLVDSDIIDFDLNDPDLRGSPTGDLHVKYRLAWDPNYLYILVEEQPGDDVAYEARCVETGCGGYGMMLGSLNYAGAYFDALALAFDFTNNRLPGVNVQMGLWVYLGLATEGELGDDLLLGAMLNTNRTQHAPAAIDDAANDVRTTGTLGSRVLEARLKWATLESAIDPWFQPDPNLLDAVKPGFIFGADPRLLDLEGETSTFTAERGMGWLSGRGYFVGWPQGNFRWPTGRDKYSTDIRLVCSAGDLDFDCDVDFVDYAQFAGEWYETDCNNINDFCNGADVVIPMNGEVDPNDLGRFTQRWLDGL